MVYEPASDEEFSELIKKGTVIVAFAATWCGPCKMMVPYFDEISKKYTSIKFLKVDIDELEETSTNANIGAMPTFFVYKNGQVIDQLVGANKEKLEALVKKHVFK